MRLLVNERRGFRDDLEGIRGICLLIILSTHLIEWPTGGFVALDLFFVLSGYLITGLLIREYERSQRIDVGAFYRRRIRRLAPAATLVIVVTVVLAFLVFSRARAVSVAWDGLWAFLLVANWNYALTGTDYFATWLPQSPLLHFWSLSVEEQFYLVWPGLLLVGLAGGAALAHRRRRMPSAGGRYGIVISVIAIVSIASFAWGVIQPHTNPAVSYLSTLTRVWELGVGALVFFANAWWRRIPGPARPALAWGGVAALLVGAVTLTPQTPYPGYWALIPVLATIGIIVSGVGAPSHLLIATNPVARYLGQISYSAYLWHWPIFVYLAALVGRESPLYLWGAVPIALVVSALAFHFVEDPIRRSRWLEPRSHRRRPRWRARRLLLPSAAVVSVVAASVAVAGAVTHERATNDATPAAHPSSSVPTPAVVAPDGAVAEIERAVLRALDADVWPQRVVEQIDSGQAGDTGLLSSTCLDVLPETEGDCVFGADTLPETAVLLGDSVALSWMPGLGPALNQLGYRVHVLTHSQCPFADVSVSGSFEAGTVRAGYPEECDDHRAWTWERVAALHPDLVVAADGEAEMQTLLTPEGQTDTQYWQAGIISSVDAMGDARVVVLTSPPQAASIAECFTRAATVADCTERVGPLWRDQVRAVTLAAEESAHPFVPVDTGLWFCSADGWCPPFVDDTVVRSDRQHLAELYARRLAPVLVEALRQAVQ